MRSLILIFVAATLIFPLHSQTVYPPIAIDQMQGGGECGAFLSARTVNGNPACAAYDEVHGDLIFRRCAAYFPQGQWLPPVTIDHTNDVGKHCSMEIVNGNPAVAYYDDTYDRLMYVRAYNPSGSVWGAPQVLEDVANQKPIYCSMRIIGGNPAIAYMDSVGMDIKYIRANDANGFTWGPSQTVVSSGQVGISTGLLSVNGKPAITYCDAANGSIYFLRSLDTLGNSWGIPNTITVSGDFSTDLDCELHLGRPVISFWNQATGTLRFSIATDSNGVTWSTPITLDTGPNVGRYSSILSHNNVLSIAYQSAAGLCAKYIQSIDSLGSQWGTPAIATQGGLNAKHYSDVLISGGCPIFFYNDTFSVSNVACTIAFDTIGAVWNPNYGMLITPDPSGKNLSMCKVGNKPVASSVNERNNKIVYCRSSDTIGTSWYRTIISSSSAINNNSTSVCNLNGYPAVAFTSSGVNRVNFIRANDTLGSMWSIQKRVDSTSSAENCQLINLNGRPAIAYYDNLIGRVKFTVASDSFGLSWSAHVLPSNLNPSDWFDIEIVNGKPAIVFTSNGTLKYIIAADSLGLSWLSPVTISTTCSQPEPSLFVISGKPAVAYQDNSTYLLTYCRSTDSTGITWSIPITTSINSFGGFCSELFVVNNRPCIAYTMDMTDVTLIQAQDSLGNQWSTDLFVDSLNLPSTLPKFGVVACGTFAGIGYYQQREKYAYYSRLCITPLNPNCNSPTAICINEQTLLQASSYGTLSWYTASSGGTYLGSGSSFSTPALTNTTTYYVQDSTCAASTRTAVTVIVNPLPTISLSGNTQLCTGDSTTLSVSGNGDGFEWSNGSINMNESFVPASTTNYWVMTYDGAGCFDTIFFSINVTPPQTTTQTIPLCDGDSYSIGNSTYSTAGTYTDTLATVQAGCDSVVVTTITIQPSIDTTVTYSQGVLSSNESGATYQWINCTTQLPVNGATNQNFTPTQNGTYAAIISAGPCTDTSECFNVTDVGIADFNVATWEFTVAPNPSSGQFTITTTGTNAASEFEIVNTLGQIVKTVTKANSATITVQIDVPGVYFVLARTGNEVKSTKIIVE